MSLFVLSLVLVVAIAVVFVACSAKVRVLNGSAYDEGSYTKVLLTINEVEYDLDGMKVGETTDYEKMDKNERQDIRMDTTMVVGAMTINSTNISTNFQVIKAKK